MNFCSLLAVRKRFMYLLFLLPCGAFAQGFLGPVDQQYFNNAKAKNFAVMSARHCDMAEFHARVAWEWMNDGQAQLAKAHSDSAWQHMDPALSWADSTLKYAAYEDSAAIALMESSQYYLFRARYAFSLVPGTNEASELDHYIWKGATSSSHATIDAYHASLLLNDGILNKALASVKDSLNKAGAANVPLLASDPPNLEKIERLEADEAAFTDLTNSYADRIKGKMDDIVQLQATLKITTDPEVRTQLEKDLAILIGDKERLENRLVAGTGQLQNIREIMSDSLVGKPEVGPEEHSVFSPPAYADNPNVDCDLPFPDGLIYKVQIGYFFPENEEQFSNFRPLTCEVISDKLVRYYAGEFTSYKEATLAKNYLRKHWFEDSFVVPFFSGMKISTSEALRLEWLLDGD